ncbi:hypothetical protein SAMN05216276_11119 [Streptosporangium subroseum]|uniref:Uncharacterized protein n=1 Tax=Streptosporangium subroseum TaxID=106412 RepID=A0A239PAN5_9ACTN|nr:hypothetical protein SAMN05216276_11119 [Streptosporangium subroseum]
MPADSQTALVNILGSQTLIAYRVDERERRRRACARAEALLRPEVLELLMSLPLEEPVAVSSLNPAERRTLAKIPLGAVSRHGEAVVRRAVQPIRVDLAVVPGRGWESALERAGRFAPFCARAILVEGPLRRPQEAMVQTDFYGIGLLLARKGAVEVVVPPRPFVRKRFTAASWQFTEEINQQLN